ARRRARRRRRSRAAVGRRGGDAGAGGRRGGPQPGRARGPSRHSAGAACGHARAVRGRAGGAGDRGADRRCDGHQRPDDRDDARDPVVREAAGWAPVRVPTFGLAAAGWRVDGDVLRAAAGEQLARVDTLPRRLPHDLTNALAAAAAAVEVGASLDGVRLALLEFEPLPHRGALVGEAGGVRWFDDSKATNPHAALAAVRGFPSVVLVAGGRNKALDLSVLAGAADHIRHVVAIGEAAPEVEAAFA